LIHFFKRLLSHRLNGMSSLETLLIAGLSPSGLISTAVWFFPFLLASLTYYLKEDESNPERRVRDTGKLFKTYDFIIVGGGSAGAVIASRLSENYNWTVLLIEAGGDETELSDVPAIAAYLQKGRLDWQYQTEPQPGRACLGHKDGRCNWPRGKVLGGSSTLNYMLYVRGNRKDYDSWEEQGNPGWGYKDILPYFLKSEDNRNPYLAATPYHSEGGYLTVQEAPWRTPLATAFVEAGVQSGYENRDGNGEYQSGFMIAQGTIRRGSRCSTAKAFLRPARNRPNLHFALNTLVLKILLDNRTKRAYGVKIRRQNMVYHVLARKELILSAGAINSPQLLMLSGIGPVDHLKEVGIKPIVSLPVGQNLQDHWGSGSIIFTVDLPISVIQSRLENVPTILKYAVFGSGPMTVLGGVEGLAWISTSFANKSLDFPDIEFHFISGNPASDGGRMIRKAHGISDKMWNYFEPLVNKDTWSLIPMILRPKSRGSVRLNSSSPYVKPVINAGYFSHADDIKIIREGIKFGIRLGEMEAFKVLGSKLWDKVMPGCEDFEQWSDLYIECLARHYTSTIYHYSGTVKMGPISDQGSVVNHELKVYNIPGLRVIDASIMPTIVSGNTNAPTIMIGEKGADMIKNDWIDKEDPGRSSYTSEFARKWPKKN